MTKTADIANKNQLYSYSSHISSFSTSRDYFYQFGELRSISMVPRQNCAFVCFTSRAAAETAAERSFGKLILKGRRMKIMWGKSQGQQPAPGKQGGTSLAPVPGLPGGQCVFNLHILYELNK